MATSSIFENFVIQGERDAQKFAEALEESAKNPIREMSAPVSEPVSVSEKIRKLFGLAAAK